MLSEVIFRLRLERLLLVGFSIFVCILVFDEAGEMSPSWDTTGLMHDHQKVCEANEMGYVRRFV